MRSPLLGCYALMAEWGALMDARTEPAAAVIKLDWWQDEMRRLAAHAPVHPISRFLHALPGAHGVDFEPLVRSVRATAAHIAGAPLATGADLLPHGVALYGLPLQVAARLGGIADVAPPDRCIEELAQAQYLARTLLDYRRDAAVGRVSLPVDELLAAGIDNADLNAADVPPRLRSLVERLTGRAAAHFTAAARASSAAAVPQARHLAVLAALGSAHLRGSTSRTDADFRLQDLYKAWTAARRAAAGR